MSREHFRSIEHLDLTNRVQQTEDRPRFVGGFSKVYYGKLRSDGGVLYVAIKRVKASIPEDEIFAKAIIKELKIWSRLDHRNVLQLRGFTLDDGEFPALVSEWMTNGKMLDHLKLNPQVDLVDMVKGIADGLMYLHKEGVVHADLKSDNVLISRSGAPLLADFGISRTLIVTHTVTTLRELTGSVRWMAFELLAPQDSGPQKIVDSTFENMITETIPAIPSMETDVWAFGMVVYELLAKEYPFAHLSIIQTVCAIARGNLPSPPSNLQSRRSIEKSLWELCTRCWNRDPELRPAMADVVREINQKSFGNTLDEQRKVLSKQDAEIAQLVSSKSTGGQSPLAILSKFTGFLRSSNGGEMDALASDVQEEETPVCFNDVVNAPNGLAITRITDITIRHLGTVFGIKVVYMMSNGTSFAQSHGNPTITHNKDHVRLREKESVVEMQCTASPGIIWQIAFVIRDSENGTECKFGPFGDDTNFGVWPGLYRFKTTGVVVAFGGKCTPTMLTGVSCITAGAPPITEVEIEKDSDIAR